MGVSSSLPQGQNHTEGEETLKPRCRYDWPTLHCFLRVEGSEITRVWNRATTDASLTLPGDRALQDALLVHGQIMNGGLLSALDYIDYDEIERGAVGLEYLGVESAAAALKSALSVAFPDGPVPADEREEYTLGLPEPVLARIEGELHEAYDLEDAALFDAFARVYRDRPKDFDPA
jgi:hypothetical protein